MELGELDQALDDVLGLLHETEAHLLQSDSVSGDPNYCEEFIAKVQVLHAISYKRTGLTGKHMVHCGMWPKRFINVINIVQNTYISVTVW